MRLRDMLAATGAVLLVVVGLVLMVTAIGLLQPWLLVISTPSLTLGVLWLVSQGAFDDRPYRRHPRIR